jgi:hypothetical protein
VAHFIRRFCWLQHQSKLLRHIGTSRQHVRQVPVFQHGKPGQDVHSDYLAASIHILTSPATCKVPTMNTVAGTQQEDNLCVGKLATICLQPLWWHLKPWVHWQRTLKSDYAQQSLLICTDVPTTLLLQSRTIFLNGPAHVIQHTIMDDKSKSQGPNNISKFSCTLDLNLA